MRNDNELLIDLTLPPDSEMRHLYIERVAKLALWLLITFAVMLVAPYLI